ncbi:hypothetical protein Pst134EA_013944 [Puccinia striiformis f. sp. tritici]|uniref:hypothetical protein n=1 Tax=Puccinia striiformis f. sp. tritici TaxID=168172 RepID=UPI0020076786|nr:hypothetical protein Pst134EA_013944 [Puccinia striiformis f. sp. tritici]KAH9466098.1 hypothetical protein Pst134EA_013944 [Puccinia striiformis f. sp. tritici]
MVPDGTLIHPNQIHHIGEAVDINTSQVVSVLLKSCLREILRQTAIESSTSSFPAFPSQGIPHDQVDVSKDQITFTLTANPFQSAAASNSKEGKEKDNTDHYSNTLVLVLIDVVCRILESMLQNVVHGQYFINLGALGLLLGLLQLP